MKPVLGKPQFKKGAKVSFVWRGIELKGFVAIVDSYGTFEQHEEPSYDIWSFLGEEVCLYKHCRESTVSHCDEELRRLESALNDILND